MAYETERNEVRWQTVRKHAKREYMRQVSEYEDSIAATSSKNNKGNISAKGSKIFKRPEEPDLKILKDSFDTEAGLDALQHLQILRDTTLKRIIKIIQLMKSFIEKLSSTKVLFVCIS